MSYKRKNLYENKNDLINLMMNFLKLHKQNRDYEIPNYDYFEENISIDEIDFYHSNAIARSSKTMAECKNIRINFEKLEQRIND